MKKIFAVAAISLMPFATTMAAQDIGCGLGTLLMQDQKGLIFRIRATTLQYNIRSNVING